MVIRMLGNAFEFLEGMIVEVPDERGLALTGMGYAVQVESVETVSDETKED